MTAAAALKLHEVAPYILLVDFGAQFAGGISINRDIFESFSPGMQKIFLDVGKEYEKKLAEAQTDRWNKSLKAMEAGGAKITRLSLSERKRWANMLPNVPMDWAKAMEEKGLPGKQTVEGFLNGLRSRGTDLPRDWDK